MYFPNIPTDAKGFSQWIDDMGACSNARAWAKGKTLREVWNTCHRGDWLDWLLDACVIEYFSKYHDWHYQLNSAEHESYINDCDEAYKVYRHECEICPINHEARTKVLHNYSKARADLIRKYVPYPFKAEAEA